MIPIRTEKSNFIHRSQNPEIPDMPGQRIQPGYIRSIWELTERERDDIFQGLNVELNFFAEPIPPVSLDLTYEGAKLLTRHPVIVAERFMGDDGRWRVRLLSEYGAELGMSKGYRQEKSAWLAQRGLKRILPTLEMWPS